MSLPEAASQSFAVLSQLAVRIRAVRTEHRVVDHIPKGKGGDDGRQRLFMMNDQFMEESFGGDLICRVEVDRTRQKSDALLPLAQLELALGLVVACPAR